jgi:response regulator RpfG family c-di-GMP phosphodiesterase
MTHPAADSPVVYIVDDATAVLSILARVANHAFPGARVITFSEPEAALAMMADIPATVLVADFRMAGMDGLSLIAEARHYSPSVYTMLTSAYLDPEAYDRLASYAVDALLMKPFSLSDFETMLGPILSPGNMTRTAAV